MRSSPLLSEAMRKAFAGTMIKKVARVKTEKMMINSLMKRMNMYLLCLGQFGETVISNGNRRVKAILMQLRLSSAWLYL